MTSAVVVLPALLALAVAFSRGAGVAFVNVYLPTLFLLPEYYIWRIPGLPDFSFGNATVFVVMGVFLLQRSPGYRYSGTDLLVFAYAAFSVISEYRAVGYKDAQNLLIDQLGYVIFPYILAKSLIVPFGLSTVVARRLVVLACLVAVISAYEFRFGRNPWQLFLGSWFPGQGLSWVVTLRWGFGRIAGPYAHAILAGVVMLVAFRLGRWLQWSRGWSGWMGQTLPLVGVSPGALLGLGVLGGLLMTLTRGPWLGALLAALVVSIGRFRDPRLGAVIVLPGSLVVGLVGGAALYSYASVGRRAAASSSQETAAYRFELLTEYFHIALEKPLLGWGSFNWPKLPGMPSIDNHYLLLFLQHGLLVLGILLLLLFGMAFRLLGHELHKERMDPPGSSLGMTLMSVFVALIFTHATVFMGYQTMPLLFMLVGWSAAYLQLDHLAVRQAAPLPRGATGYRFRRVLT